MKPGLLDQAQFFPMRVVSEGLDDVGAGSQEIAMEVLDLLGEIENDFGDVGSRSGSFASGDGDHHVECRACGYANDEAVIGRAALEARERPMTGGLPRLP